MTAYVEEAQKRITAKEDKDEEDKINKEIETVATQCKDKKKDLSGFSTMADDINKSAKKADARKAFTAKLAAAKDKADLTAEECETILTAVTEALKVGEKKKTDDDKFAIVTNTFSACIDKYDKDMAKLEKKPSPEKLKKMSVTVYNKLSKDISPWEADTTLTKEQCIKLAKEVKSELDGDSNSCCCVVIIMVVVIVVLVIAFVLFMMLCKKEEEEESVV